MSDETKNWLVRREFVNPAKINVIYQALDYESILTDTDKVLRIRNRLLNPDRDFLIVNVSRFSPGKNQELLVDSLVNWSKSNQQVKPLALFFGDGDPSKLAKYIESKNATELCKIMGFTNNIFDYLSASDVVVHTSTIDSFSQLIMEAQSLGKVVIALRVGAAATQIVNGTTGYVCQTLESYEIIDFLETLYRNPQKLKKMEIEAFAQVRKRFPLSKMLEAIDNMMHLR